MKKMILMLSLVSAIGAAQEVELSMFEKITKAYSDVIAYCKENKKKVAAAAAVVTGTGLLYYYMGKGRFVPVVPAKSDANANLLVVSDNNAVNEQLNQEQPKLFGYIKSKGVECIKALKGDYSNVKIREEATGLLNGMKEESKSLISLIKFQASTLLNALKANPSFNKMNDELNSVAID